MELRPATLLFALLLAACQPSPGSPAPATPAVTPATPRPERTTTLPIATEDTLPPVYAAITVAYAGQAGLYIWEDGTASRLTDSDPDTPLALSSDGRQVAFMRGGELLLIDSDGQGERVLIDAQEMASLATENPARLVQFSWLPGRPLLLLSTLLESAGGPQPALDLHLLHTATGEMQTVFPAGQGGLVHPSPDGDWLAVVSGEQVRLLSPDGGEEKTLLTYPPYRDDRAAVIPRLGWASDAQSFMLEMRSPEFTTIWQVPLAGEARPILQLPGYRGLSFAPDGSKFAYVLDSGMLDSPIELYVAETDGSQDTVYARAVHEDYSGLDFLGWGPDSLSFLFADAAGDIQWMKIGEAGMQSLPMPDSGPFRAMKLLWLDASHPVMAFHSPGGIWLSAPGEESLKIVDFEEGDFPPPDLGRGFDILARGGYPP